MDGLHLIFEQFIISKVVTNFLVLNDRAANDNQRVTSHHHFPLFKT